MKVNETKYRQTILFFAHKICNGTLGKLKLMKLLYFLDFDFFEKHGKSVTGDVYLRFQNGPVPRMAEKIIKLMVQKKDIHISTRPVRTGYRDQQLVEPLKNFDSGLFTTEEILMMEETAGKWEKLSGSEMKNASHGEAPWIATKPDEVIDYNLAYYRNKYHELSGI